MGLFKKIKESPTFFEEESLDKHFDDLMKWLKYLSRKDFNKVKKAIDSAYNAYQTLHGIEPEDDLASSADDIGFIETEEGK